MEKPKRNDISIGKDEWLLWQEIDVAHQVALNIDEFIEPVDDFWCRLETQCVAGCCGIDAFELWPERIRQATLELNSPDLLPHLDKVRGILLHETHDIVVSERLNNYFHRSVFLKLIEHVRYHMMSAVQTNAT